MTMRFATLLALILAAVPGRAQSPGECAAGTASAMLDANSVEAQLFNRGNLFYGVDGTGYVEAAYRVPRTATCGANSDQPCTALYAATLWVGGYVDSELRTTGATFHDYEFWPGPLQDGATLPNPTDCSTYDRIHTVSRQDVVRYLETGEATADLRDWPVAWGAPVLDGDGVAGNYDLEAGDQPAIWGEQTAWWVMNDVGNRHASGGTAPLGLEIQATAFAAPSPTFPSIDRTTFYRYRLVNRNTAPIENAYVAFWWDTDLGEASNDWMGTDTTRALVYAYNASPDGVYTDIPPAFGVRVLDSPQGEDGGALGLTASMTLLNAGGSAFSDPFTAEGFYDVMQGRWRDGTPVTEHGRGYQTPGPVTRFMLPGDPVAGTCWSATNTCDGSTLDAANRRAVASVGPFALAPGDAQEFVVALVFAVGQDRMDSVTALRVASDQVAVAWQEGALAPSPVNVEPAPPEVPGAVELEPPAPNPFRDRLTVRYTLPDTMPARITVLDMLGREVAVLAQGEQATGPRTVEVDTARWPSGVYLLRVEVGTESRTFSVVKAR